MKHYLLIAVLGLSLNVWAEGQSAPSGGVDQIKPVTSTKKDVVISGEVSIYSDDIFRGVSMSDHQPAVQGWIAASYLEFLSAGIYTTSTYFPVYYSTTDEVAKRYNVYFASIYLPTLVDELILNLDFYHYDFLEYSGMNSQEYFVNLLYRNFKFSYMHNPDYIQIGTKYEYISAQYQFKLSDQDSLTPLVSTTILEKPENVDMENYQEFRLTYTKDMEKFKVHTIFSTTNRQYHYTDADYKDSALAFGVTVPF